MTKNNNIMKKGIILSLIINFIFSSESASAKEWIYSTGTTGFQLQERTNWCWAASARNMAVAKFTSANVTKSQSQVVKQIKGSIVNEGASIKETANAITSFSKSGSATSTNSAPSLTKIKSEINKGRAVLLGLEGLLGMGHSIIVYGYDNDSKDLHIFDPRDSRIICTYEELCNGTAITGYSCTQGAYYK